SRVEGELGDFSAALRSARQAVSLVEKLVSEETAYLYDLACHHALCSSTVSAGKQEPAKQEAAEARRSGAAAVKALRQAVAAGYDNAHQLKTDPRLAPLRKREDFQKLLGELVGQAFQPDSERKPK